MAETLDCQSQDLSTDRPSAKIWTVYVSEADRQDQGLAQSWKGDMDALLIFAGLFSASITAFIIESYKTLTPDPAVLMLEQISLQIAVLTNGSQSINTLPLSPSPFTPAFSSLLCNTFWFLSLAFSLTCALAATLVDQWARNYLNAGEAHPAPHRRARIRAYLYTGLQRFGMKTVVETIPTLLHISLLLFFAGLVEFLFPINSIIRNLTIAILVTCTGLYIIITLLPILYHDCPYYTPFSSFCWWTLQTFSLNWYRRSDGTLKAERHITMTRARVLAATRKSPARDKRDEDALRWTVESLVEDSELEPFVEGIAGYLTASYDEVNVVIMRRLLTDPNIKLGRRIAQLLRRSGYQRGVEKARRAIACLSAIWSLILNCRDPDLPDIGGEEWFDDETLPILETFKYDGPIVAHYLVPTTALFSMMVLDNLSRSAVSVEQELDQLGVERPWTDIEPWTEQVQVQNYLFSISPLLSSGCIMAMKAWLERIKRTALVVKTSLNRPSTSSFLTDELMRSLWSFQAMLIEARLTVFNDFVAELLCDSPPYEAWETFYDIAIDSELSVFPVSLYNQTRLVRSLKSTKLPRLAVDHLLSMTTIVDDPKLILEAKHIIADYLIIFPDSVSASRALNLLHTDDSPASILDIFSTPTYQPPRSS